MMQITKIVAGRELQWGNKKNTCENEKGVKKCAFLKYQTYVKIICQDDCILVRRKI